LFVDAGGERPASAVKFLRRSTDDPATSVPSAHNAIHGAYRKRKKARRDLGVLGVAGVASILDPWSETGEELHIKFIAGSHRDNLFRLT
jgi:hypothetical protein